MEFVKVCGDDKWWNLSLFATKYRAFMYNLEAQNGQKHAGDKQPWKKNEHIGGRATAATISWPWQAPWPGCGVCYRSGSSTSRALCFDRFSSPAVLGMVRHVGSFWPLLLAYSIHKASKIIPLVIHLGSLRLNLHTNFNTSKHQE